jgi:hypothetical protein
MEACEDGGLRLLTCAVIVVELHPLDSSTIAWKDFQVQYLVGHICYECDIDQGLDRGMWKGVVYASEGR